MSKEKKETDPLEVELHDNLEELNQSSETLECASRIRNAGDILKVEYLIRINNDLGYLNRAVLGIEKSLARIADSLEIISAGK